LRRPGQSHPDDHRTDDHHAAAAGDIDDHDDDTAVQTLIWRNGGRIRVDLRPTDLGASRREAKASFARALRAEPDDAELATEGDSETNEGEIQNAFDDVQNGLKT
jgi:hypothetical protein